MKEWNNFLEELNKYEENATTTDLIKIINYLKNITPIEEIHKGHKCLIFKTKDNRLTLIFNPYNKVIEITTKSEFDTNKEQLTHTTYKITTAYDLRIFKEEVINYYIKVPNGYQLLIEGRESTETYTKSGFQKSKKIKYIHCPHFIFRDEEDKRVGGIVGATPGLSSFAASGHFNFIETTEEYYLSSLNNTINASKDETNNLVVFYKKDDEKEICFKAFFNYNKTILVSPFLASPIFQYNAQTASEVDEKDITFNNNDPKCCFPFLDNQIDLLIDATKQNDTSQFKKYIYQNPTHKEWGKL